MIKSELYMIKSELCMIKSKLYKSVALSGTVFFHLSQKVNAVEAKF